MRTKWYLSIRMKMVWAGLLSVLLAVGGVVGIFVAAQQLPRQWIVSSLVRGLANRIGPVPIMVTLGGALFLLAFFLLTRGTVRYIEQLNRAVGRIAEGHLEMAVPVRSADELGHLAQNLAHMTTRLRTSIEEERQAQVAKQELITNLSHDLRTPLTSMLGYLELIESDRYRDEVELRYYVSVAYGKSQQLQRMIDQLFEFTRTSHGGLRLRTATIDLGQLLRQLAEEFVPALEGAGMAYRLALPTQRIMATIDPDLMVRVFENLLSNAVRYGQGGKRVELELARQDDQLVVRVANDGEPIPQGALPHLFDTFYRAEESRSERTGGSGLGLAIAKNIVQLHGGSIAAYNEPGRTVFEVRLPAGAQPS